MESVYKFVFVPWKVKNTKASSSKWQWQSDPLCILYTLCCTCNHHYRVNTHIL